MKPILYISGYCNGALPPTIPPLGSGAPLPERKPPPMRKDQRTLPRLKSAIEKRGLDPALLAKDAEKEEKPPPADYDAVLDRMREKGIII